MAYLGTSKRCCRTCQYFTRMPHNRFEIGECGWFHSLLALGLSQRVIADNWHYRAVDGAMYPYVDQAGYCGADELCDAWQAKAAV